MKITECMPLVMGNLLQEGEDYYFSICYDAKNVFDGRYVNIFALIPVLNPFDKKYQERAAFIVRACNSHAMLVELLRRAVEGRPTQEPNHSVLGKDSMAYRNWKLWDDMRKALAAAGEQS